MRKTIAHRTGSRAKDLQVRTEVIEHARARAYFDSKLRFTTGPIELDRMIREKQDIRIVDVRSQEDFLKGHIPGAINLPKEQWSKLLELKDDKKNVVYCYNQQCHLATAAALELAKLGCSVVELEGGFDVWQKFELPMEIGNVLQEQQRLAA